ncbi:MAG: TolC family protein [Bacteriovoracaceae bacterium]|nr:TolC family protein [Bacteriovoracaceae bacterium]
MYFFLFSLLILSVSFDASSNDNLLFDQVLKKNMAIQSYEKAYDAESVKQGYLGRSFLPTLLLELGQETFQTGRYQTRNQPYGLLEARFNLFRGGRDRIESNIRDLSAQIAENNKSLAFRGELNKVRKLQYQIIYNKELISIIEKEIKDNEKIKAQASQRAQSGVATRTDTLEFTIYESELRETVESLHHENKILMIGLLPLLGLESEEGLTLSSSLEHEHDEGVLNRGASFKQHPQVAVLDAEYESFQYQKQSSNLWWTPSLDLYGGYYLYTLRDRDYLSSKERDDRVIGVRLTFEFFDGFKGSTQAKSNAHQAEAKRLMARHAERQNDAQFYMLKEEMKHTHEVMHYILDRMKKSKDYLNLTIKEYDRGVKNSLDALTAMQRYYRYEKQYLDKKKEYQVTKANLLALLGE